MPAFSLRMNTPDATCERTPGPGLSQLLPLEQGSPHLASHVRHQSPRLGPREETPFCQQANFFFIPENKVLSNLHFHRSIFLEHSLYSKR